MPAFVPEMPEQRAIQLTGMPALHFAPHIVGFRHVYGHHAFAMAGINVFFGHPGIGAPVLDEAEGKPVFGFVLAGYGQVQLQESEYQAPLGVFELFPPMQAVAVDEVGNRLVQAAGKAEFLAGIANDPVANAEIDAIAAQGAGFALRNFFLRPRSRRRTQAQHPARPRIVTEPAAAAQAGRVLEEQRLAATAFEIDHDRISASVPR